MSDYSERMEEVMSMRRRSELMWQQRAVKAVPLCRVTRVRMAGMAGMQRETACECCEQATTTCPDSECACRGSAMATVLQLCCDSWHQAQRCVVCSFAVRKRNLGDFQLPFQVNHWCTSNVAPFTSRQFNRHTERDVFRKKAMLKSVGLKKEGKDVLVVGSLGAGKSALVQR